MRVDEIGPISERTQQIRHLFCCALDLSPHDRAAFLERECADAALRAEVLHLLATLESTRDDFLECPPAIARRDIAGEWASKLVGTRIGNYVVGSVIAAGGMGCVFEARQTHPARQVALKVLLPGASSASALARFRLESEVLGRLRHPNIAHVYESGVHDAETGPLPFFAMELVPNARTIIEFAEEHRLGLRERLELFARVCDGVSHGHQKSVIHRDLKPANILVGLDGEPKIIDFGVARASDADLRLTTQLTGTGDLVGTVIYMSPEQCDGDASQIDTRSDVYSLGVVLHELLTGSMPYQPVEEPAFRYAAASCRASDISSGGLRFRQ